jgi:hypothetical protein
MMQLQPGVSVTDHVERNEIDYYAFNFDQDEEVLKDLLKKVEKYWNE